MMVLPPALPEVMFETGDIVLRAGGRAERLFFLKSGSVEIVRNNVRVITVATPGAVLGEISALLGCPHIATVRALEPTVMLVADDPAAFLASHPDCNFEIARALAARLQRTTEFLTELKSRSQADEKHRAMIHGVLQCLLEGEGAVAALRDAQRQTRAG